MIDKKSVSFINNSASTKFNSLGNSKRSPPNSPCHVPAKHTHTYTFCITLTLSMC